MNHINPQKLHNSKWTAIKPSHKEKHFIVIEITFDDEGISVTSCKIEAVMTKSVKEIDWHELKDNQLWLQGWK